MSDLPFVSILLPVRNEAGFISKSLAAVLEQDYPPEKMEILVADGYSDDSTRRIVMELAERSASVPLRIIDNPGMIVSKGLNAALREARGDIIIRVDGHCVIARDYVSRCVDYLVTNRCDGVGGPMVTIGETPLSRVIAHAMSTSFGVGNSAFRTSQGRTMLADTVPFPAYTRQIIKKIGFYDEELVRDQDDEYNYRLREHGGKVLLASDIQSEYFSRGSLRGVWKQYYQYGYWKVRVLQKHPLQMSLRQFIPPIFVLLVLASVILAFLPGLRWLSIVAPGSYLLANLFYSLGGVQKFGWRGASWLPIIFTILHISYGSGFLTGLFVFAGRWGDRVGKTPLV